MGRHSTKKPTELSAARKLIIKKPTKKTYPLEQNGEESHKIIPGRSSETRYYFDQEKDGQSAEVSCEGDTRLPRPQGAPMDADADVSVQAEQKAKED